MVHREDSRERDRLPPSDVQREAFGEAWRLEARISELEATNAALSEAVERARRELAHHDRDRLDAEKLRARLAAAERSAEDAWARNEALREELERVRAELAALPRLEEELRQLELRLVAIPDGAASEQRLPPGAPPAPRAAKISVEPPPSLFSRRLAKLRRDPKGFLEDSRFRLARSLARVL